MFLAWKVKESRKLFSMSLAKTFLELTSEKNYHYAPLCFVGNNPGLLLIRTRTKYIVNWQSPLDNTFLIADEKSLTSERTILWIICLIQAIVPVPVGKHRSCGQSSWTWRKNEITPHNRSV